MKILAFGFLSLCGLLLGQQTTPPATPAPQTTQQTQPVPPQPAPPPAPTPPPANRGGYDPSENPFFIEVFGFLPHAKPDLLGGKQATDQTAESLRNLGKTRVGEGVMIAFPAGKGNLIEVSGFQDKGRGGPISPQAVTLFGTTFAKGDVISTAYTLRNIKVSFNYLSYPAPPGDSKWRFKTLYEVQYVSFHSSYNSASEASPLSVIGNKGLFLPTFGVGLNYLASKNFHIEMRASGFAIPHHAVLWDAEATAVIRAGHLNILVGGKGFHFKTSPAAEEYFRSTLYGPFAALRYTFR